MTRFEAHRFATAWIGYWEEYERTGQFADSMSGIDQDALNDADPDFRLKVVLDILNRIDNDPDNHLMQVLAATPWDIGAIPPKSRSGGAKSAHLKPSRPYESCREGWTAKAAA